MFEPKRNYFQQGSTFLCSFCVPFFLFLNCKNVNSRSAESFHSFLAYPGIDHLKNNNYSQLPFVEYILCARFFQSVLSCFAPHKSPWGVWHRFQKLMISHLQWENLKQPLVTGRIGDLSIIIYVQRIEKKRILSSCFKGRLVRSYGHSFGSLAPSSQWLDRYVLLIPAQISCIHPYNPAHFFSPPEPLISLYVHVSSTHFLQVLIITYVSSPIIKWTSVCIYVYIYMYSIKEWMWI